MQELKIKKPRSIANAFSIVMVTVAFLSSALVGYFWISHEIKRFRQDSVELEREYIKARKDLLKTEVAEIFNYIEFMKASTEKRLKQSIKSRVNEAHSIATNIHATYSGKRSDHEIKEMIKEALRPIRFNKSRGYFFAGNFMGVEQLFADKPQLEGKNLYDLKSDDDKFIIREMIELCRKDGEGFVHYLWSKPEEKGTSYPKIAFVKHFKPYDWFIGTGEYLDDVEKDIKNEALSRIMSIKFRAHGYAFVTTYHGTVLAHGEDKSLIGRQMKDEVDADGKLYVHDIIRAGKTPGGNFVMYKWPKPDGSGISRKLSFIKGVDSWEWIIGTGDHIDEINTIIDKLKQKLKKDIQASVLNIVTILLITLTGIALSAYFISRKVSQSFSALTAFFHKAATHNVKIDPREQSFREFSLLSVPANKMVEEREHSNRKLRKAQEKLELQVEERTKELKEAQNYITNIINSMPSVLVGIDAKGMVTQWNHEAKKRTGITENDARGKYVTQVLPEIADRISDINSTIKDRISQESMLLSRPFSQSPGFFEMTVYPLSGNQTAGAVIRIDDVTERRHMQETMIQTEKMMSVGELAAGMAHEIKNPLAGVLQNLQVIQNRMKGSLPKNISAARQCGTDMKTIEAYWEARNLYEMTDNAMNSGHRAAKIVENMLSFSRKSDTSAQAKIDIRTLLDKSLELSASQFDLKKDQDFRHIQIKRDYDSALPDILCDPSKVQQVFMNILKNGAEAMQTGTRENQPPCFFLKISRDDNMAVVEIEDNGPGMPESIRRRIFEPFFTTKTKGKGTGLGLSVSYFIIAESQGGTITVDSTPGKGTNFIIKLPFA